ncbi:MAG: glycosyltransferase [Cyclobacteriaceae bacterium]|nr:glycosyltransferase [Cyclobacteriaceae bacterium]
MQGVIKRRTEFLNHFEELAPQHVAYREKYSYFWDNIVDYFNYFIHESDTVLEVGCATGETLARLKGHHKTGIDFSPGMIEQARSRHPELEFILADVENIPDDRQYDVIIVSHAIGYFVNVLSAFKAIKKACHPKTKVIVNYYNFLWEPVLRMGEFLRFKKKSPRQNWLTRHDLEILMYLAGFENYRHTRRMIFPLRIPFFSYFINKYLARLPLINYFCLNQYTFARVARSEDSGDYSVSIVIPARNESGNLEYSLKRMPKFGKSMEIIFVEGNSTDDTWHKMQLLPQRFPDWDLIIAQQNGKGKGDAVRKGFSLATGDILMILDADLTVAPEDLPAFYDAIAGGKGEFINGARLVYPMEKNAMRFLNLLGNKFFSLLFSWLLEQPVRDTLCGTKVIFRADYQKLIDNRQFFGNFDPFGDFDLIFGAYKLNLKIVDLPVRYHERKYGDTNISRFSHGFLLLRMAFYAARKIKFW